METQEIWREFSERFKGSPLLARNPLYALPLDLIQRIKNRIPSFWSSEEVRFEEDLAKTTTGGFFYERPIRCPFLESPKTPEQEHLDPTVDDMWIDVLKGQGLNDSQIEHRLQSERDLREDVKLRDLAYSAWLVTNPLFLTERDSVRSHWEERVAAARRFPSQRISALGEEPGPVSQDEAYLLMFFRRWGLLTFLTWEVPVPMMPQIDAVLYHDVIYKDALTLGGAGLFLFLPWHLLRDETFNLRQLVSSLRQVQQPAHLNEWFSLSGQKLGYKRLKNLFVIIWCLKWALGARYGNRLTGKMEMLDEVIGRFLELSSDSVKKLRPLMEMKPPES